MAEPKNKINRLQQEPSHCLLCGQLGPALSHGHWICEHCKIVVQAEVLSKKLKIEKEGRGPTCPGMLADASRHAGCARVLLTNSVAICLRRCPPLRNFSSGFRSRYHSSSQWQNVSALTSGHVFR